MIYFQNVAAMPVEKDSEIYNMNHKRRGFAIIFNHKNFDQRLGLKVRNGTDTDRDNLEITLKRLDFEVRVYNDCAYKGKNWVYAKEQMWKYFS